ncbi:MAG: CDP-alcohol phosphatidyltransferase family protein [Candidatus Andersenbacteria bacterium]
MQGRYLTAANIITAVRLGLFVGFLVYLIAQRPLIAVTLLLLSWALDAVDGWVARAWHEESEIGSLVDKTIDRLIIGFGVIALILAGYLPPIAAFLLTKEAILLPALVLHSKSPIWTQGLGVFGKGMTLFQGVAVAWLLAGFPYGDVAIGLVAITGGVGAGWYLVKKV